MSKIYKLIPNNKVIIHKNVVSYEHCLINLFKQLSDAGFTCRLSGCLIYVYSNYGSPVYDIFVEPYNPEFYIVETNIETGENYLTEISEDEFYANYKIVEDDDEF